MFDINEIGVVFKVMSLLILFISIILWAIVIIGKRADQMSEEMPDWYNIRGGISTSMHSNSDFKIYSSCGEVLVYKSNSKYVLELESAIPRYKLSIMDKTETRESIVFYIGQAEIIKTIEEFNESIGSILKIDISLEE